MKVIIVIFVCACTFARCSDSDLADALAEAGAAQSAKGHFDKAKDTLYRALSYDIKCPVALFELAKIEEKEGNKSVATTLYCRALPHLKDSRRAVCVAKLKSLNPCAIRLSDLLEEYSKSSQAIVTKYPTPEVVGAVAERRERMGLSPVVMQDRIQSQSLPIKPTESFNPIGRWAKQDQSVLTIKSNHTLELTGVTGRWKVSGQTLVIDFDRFWGHKDCPVTDNDTFAEGLNTFTRIK